MLYSQNENIFISIDSNKKIKLSDLIFFTAFLVYLINQVLKTTMFNVYIGDSVSTIVNLFAMLMLMIKIMIFDKYTFKNIVIMGLLGVASIIIYRASSYIDLIYLVIFIIAAKNVDFKKIVQIFLYVKIIITILAMIACKLGLIEHIVYFRDGKYRYSFGSVYATDFAAGIFFSIVAYCYIKFEKLKIGDVIIFIGLGCFTDYYCDARVDSISIFMVAIICSYFIIRNKIINKDSLKINKIIRILLIIAVPISSISSIFITKAYSPSNKLMVNLNKLLSDRLNLGKIGIDKYGFKLFGQSIRMVGNGGTNVKPTDYFFIDSSYLFIVLRYGIVILVFICILYMFFINKALKEGNIILPIIITFIAINSIVAHHFMDIAYNPFMLIFFAINNIGINSQKNNLISNKKSIKLCL